MTAFRPRPNWLDEEPVLQLILNDLLDQLEKNIKPFFRVNPKTTPEFFDTLDDDPRYLWDLVKTLDKEYHVVSVRKQRGRTGKEIYENAQILFNPDKEPQVREWLNRPAFDPYSLTWNEALEKYRNKFEDNGEALEQPIRVETKTANEVIQSFSKLANEISTPQTLRNLSSKCFWGDSKFLDSHSKLVHLLYPEASHNILPRPIMLNIALPDDIHEVIFVENQDSFLMLKQLALKDPRFIKTAFVFSSGFKATSPVIRRKGQVLFSVVNGSSPESIRNFEQWWFDRDSSDITPFFWGDMDYAGITILKSLKHSFADISAWKMGYDLMLKFHDDGHGHKIRDSKKMQQLDPGTCNCRYTDDEILPAIRHSQRFLDQEIVASKDFLHHSLLN